MGFLFGGLEDEKKKIKQRLTNNVIAYNSIIEKTKAKAKDRLDTPLHLTGHLLNLYNYYEDEVGRNHRVMEVMSHV